MTVVPGFFSQAELSKHDFHMPNEREYETNEVSFELLGASFFVSFVTLH